MNSNMEKARSFKDKLALFLRGTSKQTWTKEEVGLLIKNLWIDFLEDHIK